MDQPASTRELLAAIEQAQAELAAAIAPLGEDQLIAPGVESDWSIKDILAHITFWHRRLAHILGCVARGEAFERLAQEGENGDAAINRANAENHAANKARPLAEVRAEYAQAFGQALAAVGQLRDEDLAPESAFSSRLGGSPVQLIAGDTYEHYSEHLDSIRAWLSGED